MDATRRALAFVRLTFDFICWRLDIGHWDIRRWTLHGGRMTLDVGPFDVGRCTLDVVRTFRRWTFERWRFDV